MTQNRYRLLLASFLSISMLTGLGACQPYVNIPAQSGDIASANANGRNVRSLMGEALRSLRGEALTTGLYKVLLPAGSTPETYQEILAVAGESYVAYNSPQASQAIDQIEVRAIRIRGWGAAVDFIRSSQPGVADAPRQLVTVYLKDYIVGGWGTQRVRVWRMNVADALAISAGEDAAPELDAPVEPQTDMPIEDQPEVPVETPAETSAPAME